MDPLEEMEAIAADPDYCPTCHTKFLVDDTGTRMCAARCTETEGNKMTDQLAVDTTVGDLRIANDRLTRVNAEHERVAVQLRERIAQLESDLRIIGQALHEEACNRDWCSEYDSFADDVNSRTHGEWLLIREKEYNVRYIVTVNFKCRVRNYDDVASEIYGALESIGDRVDTDCDDFEVSVDS